MPAPFAKSKAIPLQSAGLCRGLKAGDLKARTLSGLRFFALPDPLIDTLPDALNPANHSGKESTQPLHHFCAVLGIQVLQKSTSQAISGADMAVVGSDRPRSDPLATACTPRA